MLQSSEFSRPSRRTKDVRIIGSNSNQNDIVPRQTLGSVVIDLPHTFLLIAREVQKQRFSGRVFSLGLDDNVVKFVPNPGLEGSIPKNVTAAVDSVERLMIAGSFAELHPVFTKGISTR